MSLFETFWPIGYEFWSKAERTTSPSSRRRIADEVHDSFVGPQWAATPMDGDVREEPVFNLVPLAGSGREMADVDAHLVLVREIL